MSRFLAPTLILRSWAVASQGAACRNAMTASTALAARRLERLEVEEFLRMALTTAVVEDRDEDGGEARGTG